ncbi:MAG: D-2-hydroxyacid dehydrogenase [Puniceicoccaceae bacterium]
MGILLVSLEEKHLTAERREILQTCSVTREVVFANTREEILPFLDRIEVALGKFPRDVLGMAPNLVWFQQLGTGTEWLSNHPEAIEHPFMLTNCSDDYGVVLAEHVMALILAVARQLPEHFAAQQRREWGDPPFSDPRKFELRGKNLLLVGVGSIGMEIARRASGFAMHISGLRSAPATAEAPFERMYGSDQLPEALSNADLVVNSLPLTPSTRGFFDRQAIGHMKPGACFFNIGRGQTVDEAALIEALQSGRLAGAGLDVFAEEPLPSDSPLWGLSNVIITPHDGGNHDKRYESWVETVFDNLQRFSTGEPLRNVVDKRSGY